MNICELKRLKNKKYEKDDRPLCFSLSKSEIDDMNKYELLDSMKTLKYQKDRFKLLIDKFDELNDIEFLDYFRIFYRWNDSKILVKLNKQLKIKNPIEVIIKTDDYTSILHQEGSGRDFSYWYVWYPASYEIICDESFKFEDRVYTRQEISELCKQNKIVVLNSGVIGDSEEVSEDIARSKHNELCSIPLTDSELFEEFAKFNSYFCHGDKKAESKIFKLIREDVTKQDLLNDYKTIFKETNKNLFYVTNAIAEQNKYLDDEEDYEDDEEIEER